MHFPSFSRWDECISPYISFVKISGITVSSFSHVKFCWISSSLRDLFWYKLVTLSSCALISCYISLHLFLYYKGTYLWRMTDWFTRLATKILPSVKISSILYKLSHFKVIRSLPSWKRKLSSRFNTFLA